MISNKKNNKLTEKQRKTLSAVSIVFFVLFTVAVTWVVGRPMVRFVSEPEKFRAWVEEYGIMSRFIFIAMTMFQVIIAIIPGEPLEIGAGYAFGTVEGTILCVIGITVGSLITFLLVRHLGVKFVEVFFAYKKIRSLKFLKNEKNLDFVIFLAFFLPGTPKDLLTYFIGLTDIKLSKFIFIVLVARLPSVITSTVGGGALGIKNYTAAIIVFAITVVLSLAGFSFYNLICRHRNK